MKIAFPYHDVEPLDIPDSELAGVYALREAPATTNLEQRIAEALAQPIGAPPLRECVRPGMKVTVVVDDGTRTTRTDVMLPAVIAAIESAGVADKDISVMVALGTHRRMTRDELALKYTPALVTRHAFVFPNWKNPADYVTIPADADFAVRIHRQLPRSDFVVGVGQTVPHLIAGFGGGCKIINPGCADPETIGQMHWQSRKVRPDRLFAVRDNPVRRLIDEVGLKAGLKFIVNEVPGKDDAVAGVFAGDPILAHRRACDFALEACTVEVTALADIVVADAYPCDSEFWQSLKGLNAACAAVKPGGTVILVAPCPEGACAAHPDFAARGFRHTIGEVDALVAQGAVSRIVGAVLYLGAYLVERARVILVSSGVSSREAAALGIEHASTPAQALALARSQQGANARINVLSKAAKMIVRSPGAEPREAH
ncbi:MAG: nickel-dependent lactate racemase [Kiritimatiellae bacterium]|nr:nickel-dependent lactate racemase [Kiritimatiellia bacterium]